MKIIEWLEDMIPGEVQMLWRDLDIVHPKRAWRKMRNVIYWIPILWDDEDWDHEYFYTIMREKLKRMREHFAEHRMHESWEETVEQISVMERSLHRLIEDRYMEKEFEEFNAKRGQVTRILEVDGTRTSSPMPDKESEELRKLFDREEMQKDSDRRTVAHIFYAHSHKWWD